MKSLNIHVCVWLLLLCIIFLHGVVMVSVILPFLLHFFNSIVLQYQDFAFSSPSDGRFFQV